MTSHIRKWYHQIEKYRHIFGNNKILMSIRCDRGSEFLNKDMNTRADEIKICIEPTVGYRPESNGIAERANRTILEKGNCIRFKANQPAEYWEFSLRTAGFLY